MKRLLRMLGGRIPLLALGLGTTAIAQGPGFDAVRIEPLAEREYAGQWAPLLQAERVSTDQRVRTSSAGRLALQLSGNGLITLGGDSLLRVHDTESATPPSRMGLARVQLLVGVARIDASRHDKLPSADMRVNLRALKLRVFGADLWAQTDMDADEVCLLRGAVEIMTPAGAERLDNANSCLHWNGSEARHLPAESAVAMAARLARTAFPGEFGAAPARGSDATMPSASSGVTIIISGVAASDPDRYWSLVLASLPTAAAAEQAAAQLLAQGMEVVVEPAQHRGRRVYRLTFGTFDTRAAAQAALQELRSNPAFAKAWLLDPA